MILSLMRHGIAEAWTGNDATRALTPEGGELVRDLVIVLKAGGWLPGAIICSPLVRSQQTAAIILDHFPGVPLEVLNEVIHTEASLLDEVGYRDYVDPVIVGHQPGISRLARQLLGSQGTLPFEPATVACLRLDGLPPRRPAELHFFAPSSFARVVRR